jgi:translocation and assembly module TamA
VATWARIGHIFSSPLDRIPLNQRFYSGGANSVRGYGFQKLGPISAKGKPTGGQTQFEGGLEPRLRIGENLGASLFVEAGQVSSKKLMQRTSHGKKHSTHRDQFLVGYGVGLKYYTEIGPFRFDVAFPTQKRRFKKKRYDAPFQVYMSIGQAF